MSNLALAVPDISCAYEEYDPSTLVPVNQSTFTRLMELGWDKSDFEGKSVLDIGGNSGILSLYAMNLGAEDISYADVQAPLVDFFQSVVTEHNLPISVEKKGFLELSESEDQKDIVLFMEVLHWIIDQGGNVADSIEKLAGLTRETLYLETPWDVNEPSIASRGKVTEEEYSMELIVRELNKYFENVQLVRFMSYFGDMQNSKRILIKASGRKVDSAQADNVIPVDFSMKP